LCQRRLDIAALEKKYAIVFVKHFAQVLPLLLDMQVDNLLLLSDNELLVTRKGHAFMRNICMLFDEYVVGHLQSQTVRYSRTL
jgi:oxygen-independent coproporphyrinogen-3 oxidase